MMKSARNALDQKVLLDVLLQICEKGQTNETLEMKDIVQDIVVRLKPYF